MNDQGIEITPPEDRIPREQRERPLVDMGRGRVGFEVTDPNDPVDVTALLFADEEIQMDNPERITDIYLTTADGNIFRIVRNNDNGLGEMIDASKSRMAGGNLHVTTAEEPEMTRLEAVVGQPFDFLGIKTPPILKISAVNESEPYDQKVIDEQTSGRKSNITSDFKTACLPEGADSQS
jgi:hypothetical protein